MQLKEEFCTYEALRREHDAQIVQIATEAGLRIAPEQWSSLLYGDTAHKSHMQSIIDKVPTTCSFCFVSLCLGVRADILETSYSLFGWFTVLGTLSVQYNELGYNKNHSVMNYFQIPNVAFTSMQMI